MPRIAPPNDAAIAEGAAMLRAGRVVAFATETVYGLGAGTFNVNGLRVVYALKGRPANNPLIAHVIDAKQAALLTTRWDDRCEKLASVFWPGPLTLVVPKADGVPAEATAGLRTVAVRSPAHAVARQLLHAFGEPISAPSANRSGHVSSTRAEHVAAEFAGVDDLLIIDGGPCEVGIESTVLDLTSERARILRPGSVTAEQLRAVLGEVDVPAVDRQSAAPGTSLQHYAPITPAELVAASDVKSRLSEIGSRCAVLCFDSTMVSPPHIAIVMPREARAYAHELYQALRSADAAKCERILIESPPHSKEGDRWHAVHDRLKRATA